MKKKIIIILLVLIMVMPITGCKNKKTNLDETENSKITKYIKKNLNPNWEYSNEKYKIHKNHAIEIVFNNMDDWSYCADSTNESVVNLNKNHEELLKKIPRMTFFCKLDGEVKAKIIYENISIITKDNVEQNAKYYDANNNLINKTAESGFKESCTVYGYKEIFRNPEDYLDKRMKLTGEVIQVLEENKDGIDYWVLRVNMTKDEYGYYDDTILIMINKNKIKGRIIEEDIYTFYGILQEPVTYDTVLGSSQTIPFMLALYGNLEN